MKTMANLFAGKCGGLTIILLLLFASGCGSSSDDDPLPIINNPPVADAGANQQAIINFGSVTLDGSGSSDPDNDTLTYLWEFLQLPTGSSATLSNSDTAVTGFTPDVVGSYRVQLTVSDGTLTDAAVIDIDVAANQVPTANAGPDQTTNRSEVITLDGSGSSDPDGHPLTYTWTQLSNQCPDVTGGTGRLTGEQPTLTTPDVICTIIFDLRVDDGDGASFADRVYVFVLEDKDHALFVNDAGGDDSNAGSRALPMKTVQAAINKAYTDGNGADVYVAQATYNVATLELAYGVSLYGGYNNSWERDTSIYTTVLQGNTRAINGDGDGNLSIDGFNITSADATTNGSTYAIALVGGDRVRIANNIIIAGHAGYGASGSNGINGSDGGNGGNGGIGSCDGATWGTGGAGGNSLDGRTGGNGGRGGEEGPYDGMLGGTGVVGTPGGDGGFGGDPGLPGEDGTTGADGYDGADGMASTAGRFTGTGWYSYSGSSGTAGSHGNGGGGGGGGGGQGGPFTIYPGAGNGGGGGGGGGSRGTGAAGGQSGGGSIGLFLNTITNAEVVDNVIIAGSGGMGGDGGVGGLGGAGGNGGFGGNLCTNEIGAGGNGGFGGNGGNGGNGGAGAGGPSVGIATNIAITNTGNTITVASPASGGLPNGLTGFSLEVYDW